MKRIVASLFGITVLATGAIAAQPAQIPESHIPTFAQVASQLQPNNCRHENVQISTQYNYRNDTLDALMKQYDNDKKTVQEVAGKSGVKARIANENYNVAAVNDGYQRGTAGLYNLNGSSSYVVVPMDKAKAFFTALANAGITGRMSYSMNDNCKQ